MKEFNYINNKYNYLVENFLEIKFKSFVKKMNKIKMSLNNIEKEIQEKYEEKNQIIKFYEIFIDDIKNIITICNIFDYNSNYFTQEENKKNEKNEYKKYIKYYSAKLIVMVNLKLDSFKNNMINLKKERQNEYDNLIKSKERNDNLIKGVNFMLNKYNDLYNLIQDMYKKLFEENFEGSYDFFTEIAKKMENTLTVLKSEHGGDAVHYGKRLMLQDYGSYETVKNQWDKAFHDSKTSINVNVTIRRIGEETFHSKK